MAVDNDHFVELNFFDSFTEVQKAVHATAVSKGWWEDKRSVGDAIALMHSELSEALEAERNGNPPDKHCRCFSSLEVELADAIIRIMDFAEFRDLDLAGAILVKAAFNKTRERKHGKKF